MTKFAGMNILCLAATAFEIAPFLRQKPSADHLITGIGSPMAIYHIAKRLQQLDYDLVIQAGIAGSFTSSLELGEVVLVSRDCFADIGISEQQHFSTLFEKGFMDENEWPFTKGWLENTSTFIDNISLRKAPSITVNTVTDDATHIKMLQKKYDAELETMEGAALHYTCRIEKVPFLQLRSISNYVGERDKSKWNMQESVYNLNESLLTITEQLISGDIEITVNPSTH